MKHNMVRKILKKIRQNSRHDSMKNTESTSHNYKNKVVGKENYKNGLLEVDVQEEKYNRLFEQKLADQYKEFKNIKEHHIQIKKFIRILAALMTIILIALLIMSFG